MAFQFTTLGVLIWRFITGIGIGIELVTIDAYIAELMPKEIRGRAFALNQVVQFTTIPLVALISWLLVPRNPFGIDGWRWVVLIGSAGAIFVWFIRRGIPESPRWLIARGHISEAERAVTNMEKRVEAEFGAELPPIVRRLPRKNHANVSNSSRSFAALSAANAHAHGFSFGSNRRLLRFRFVGAYAADRRRASGPLPACNTRSSLPFLLPWDRCWFKGLPTSSNANGKLCGVRFVSEGSASYSRASEIRPGSSCLA